MENQKVYFSCSTEIEDFFSVNEVSVAQLLMDSEINAEITYEALPCDSVKNERCKDLVTVIVASSIGISTIVFSIVQLLNTLYRKPYWIEFEDLEELRDAKGNILLDDSGKPFMKSKNIKKLIEPKKKSEINKLLISFNMKDGIVFKVKTNN